MDVKERAKSIIKNYIDAKLGTIKKVAILVAGVGLGGLIMLSGIGGAGEEYENQQSGNSSGMSSASSTLYFGTISINETSLSKEEFIKCVEEYKDSESYQTKFGQYAGMIYDVCTSKNINPELCVAQANKESGFGNSVPENSPWNYWGLAVYNDSNTGKEFNSLEDAVRFYCDHIVSCQTGNNEPTIKHSKEYAQYTDKITGNLDTVYDVLCAYAYLGDYHNGKAWTDSDGHIVTVKEHLTTYMKLNCTHTESEATTMEERTAYILDYVDQVLKIATKIFGDSTIKNSNQVGDRIKVTITGEIGGEFTKVEPGYTDNNGDGIKDAGKYKFHSNITGLDHWGIYAQKHLRYRYNGNVYTWDQKCNRGAEFIILSGYTSSPFSDNFLANIRGKWDESQNTRYNNYGLEIVKNQTNNSKPENGNDLMLKYVAQVQSAVPKGGYVVLYIRNTELDEGIAKENRAGAVTPNIKGKRWTRQFHFVSIIGYDQINGKECMFVAETANGCTGWYPIEEFEQLTRGYITQIVTIMPKQGK